MNSIYNETIDLIDNTPPVIGSLIIDFAPEPPWRWNSQLGFFNNLSLRYIAHQLVGGHVDAAIHALKRMVHDCPSLMHEICEATDPLGRRMRGTLLQLAAMNFDFNPMDTAEPFGAVERLVALGLLSEKAIEDQLNKVLGPGSEVATQVRTDRLKAAVEALVEDIARSNLQFFASWELVRPQAEAIVDRFRATVFNFNEEVITAGLVFDPELLVWFIDHFWGDNGLPSWANRLDDPRKTTSNLLWLVGLGSLQAADSACGLQLSHQGIYKVVMWSKRYERSFSKPDPNLGSWHFFDLYSGSCQQPPFIRPLRRNDFIGIFTALLNMCANKKASLASLLPTLEGGLRKPGL